MDYSKKEILEKAVLHPNHKGLTPKEKEDSLHKEHNKCSDEVWFFLKIDNNVIKKIKYDAFGCFISLSASEILSQELVGKQVDEAINLLNNFSDFINSKTINVNLSNKLRSFDILQIHKNRIKCAETPLLCILEILKTK